jgi:hypothetical protein
MLRVGRRVYGKGGKYIDPSFPGFTPILCLTKSSPYGDIGPYIARTKDGTITENDWQFKKLYEKVPAVKMNRSRYDNTTIWQHPAEYHIKNFKLTPEFSKWQKKGFETKEAIRYPVGIDERSNCLCSIVTKPNGELDIYDYITGRSQVYQAIFCDAIRGHQKIKDLRKRLLEDKENLLIIEVDGPHQEGLEYYKLEYGVKDDFIINNTILVTKENMEIMRNDLKFAYGHGYCVAITILGKDKEWIGGEPKVKMRKEFYDEHKNRFVVVKNNIGAIIMFHERDKNEYSFYVIKQEVDLNKLSFSGMLKLILKIHNVDLMNKTKKIQIKN